ncbi:MULTISPECIES: 3-hydroxyacyl-CoA dehydrogenase family protein [Streptomyces]|uniref:3-hydroxybutyryl-CoA dehydrogenase n=1 Tax=Streptomyces harbinensis TaxID=1176198 RepID=A0A1I6VZE9_9ACTN|nr:MULTISPECIES: 3-hydroxyacyl-CoA dehydrogenase family protein [Streptomyces]MCK1814231.1 3-hydroxyacyl-CoA dehydrogenase family protein [Streptomyces sp. XM4011]QKV70898.1 3-hydroxyacyl-CoA dehydrogenase family protein [Streptomyces harbinensis]SFT19073.1 3-hydroxybutyryl-CoA dehydrogenase [Streptomyces harbinensis]
MARNLAVVGAGLMGSGIAQVAATGGWTVTLVDTTEQALARGRGGIEASLEKFVGKGKLSEEDAGAALGRISTGTALDAAADADLVVEAVFEQADIKRDIFATLDGLVKDTTVLASNTSAIPITKLAAATSRPERVVGTHFFSPVPMMALCELVRGRHTSDETLATARAFAESAGKTCIVVNRDVAGFVTTRLISALIVEAAKLHESGVATAEDIDLACKLGFGHAMGPLATADLTGVDVLTHATENIYTESRDEKFAPPESMRRMVDAGDLGRKSGRGFHTY